MILIESNKDKIGEVTYDSKLIALMYGSLVTQTIQTSSHITEANERLQKIGYRIGIKIVDEFMRENGQVCQKYFEVAERFCTVGVRKFINVTDSKCDDFKQNMSNGFCFKLKIIGNPLLKYIELPTDLKNSNLKYQSILKGMIVGTFEVLKFKTEVTLIYENLKGEKNETIFFIDASKDQQKH